MECINIYEKIKRMTRGTEIPKTIKGPRIITRIKGNKIYIRCGVKTDAEKYITTEMVEYACNKIKSNEPFTSADLKLTFPREYGQEGCVFSMTGGFLKLWGIARYAKGCGYIPIKS